MLIKLIHAVALQRIVPPAGAAMAKRLGSGRIRRWRALSLAAICVACAIPATAGGPEVKAGADPEGTAQQRRSVFGQKLDVGFMMGTTVTSDYNTGYIWTSQNPTEFVDPKSKRAIPPGPFVSIHGRDFARPLLGAFAEVGIANRLSLQATVLFRSLVGKTDVVSPNEDSHTLLDNDPEEIVEVPLLVKYKFGNQRIRPFVGVGPAFRFGDNPQGQSRGPFHGATAGLGLDLRWGRRSVVSPQANYTRWATAEIPGLRGGLRAANQVQFLIGISF